MDEEKETNHIMQGVVEENGEEKPDNEIIKTETTSEKMDSKVEESSVIEIEKEEEQKSNNKKDRHVFAVPGLPALNAIKKPEDDDKQVKDSDADDEIRTEVIVEKPKQSSTASSAKKCPLEEPPWGGVVSQDLKLPYSMTILKDGTVKDTVDLTKKSRFVFGRNDDCDVRVEHPSCSRYHAVLQYCVVEKDLRKKGFYLYDMGSTHGTYLNKVKIKPQSYNRVRVGYQLKFGGSTRLYIVEGPEEDQEEETDIDKMREKKRLYEQHKMEEKQKRKSKEQPLTSTNTGSKQTIDGGKGSDGSSCDDGASWGFGEDAQEEGINLKDLFERKQDFEVKDPKKTLNGFFEREGIEFEYEMSERGSGKSTVHVAKVRLPFDTDDGEEVIAEGTSSNKKDAVLKCATEACRLIQTYDMMTNRTREDQRVLKQRALEANDFYDSDEDSFLDRTGNIEKKRIQRKKRAGKQEKDVVETHDTLKVKLEEKKKELRSVEKRLGLSRAAKNEGEGGGDSLDSFMSSMSHRLDKTTEMKLKRQSAEFKKEIQRLEKMVEITKPALPSINMTQSIPVESKKEMAQKQARQPPQTQPQASKGTTKSTNHEIKLATMSTAQILKSQPKPSTKSKSDSPEEHKENGNSTALVRDNPSKTEEEAPPAKKKKVYSAPKKPDYKPEKEFVDWTPPSGQTGDGRTALNDKLGY